MGKIPEPLPGYKRQWVKCRECGQVAYYDYIPFSLANPVMTLPCGHGSAQRFYDAVKDITLEQAQEEMKVRYFTAPGPDDNPNGPGWYFTDETVAPNMHVIKHIGPYQDRETAELALMRFNDAVRALRGPGGPYIHLRERKNETE